jgi:2-methylcitrate dehydratase PrpD
MKTVAERLVNTLLKLKFEEIPSEVMAKAKLCVLDTLGVALAGSKTSVGRIARNFAVSMGGAKVGADGAPSAVFAFSND